MASEVPQKKNVCFFCSIDAYDFICNFKTPVDSGAVINQKLSITPLGCT